MEKLKQKVASSSSRVIASIQQAAAGNFQQQQPQATNCAFNAEESTSSQVIQQPMIQQQQIDDSPPTAPVSAVRMMAADATAHLTENERKILLEVFKKEEQFQRDTIQQMAAARTVQSPAAESFSQSEAQVAGYNDNNNNSKENNNIQRRATTNRRQTVWAGGGAATAAANNNNNNNNNYSSQPSRSATPGLAPSRAASSCGSSVAGSPLLGQCRICRKHILANEPCHLCSACNQFVCEDCGSYSANNQHWTCSSCRRRATKPALPVDVLKELGLGQNSCSARRMTIRQHQAELLNYAAEKSSAESNISSSNTSSSGCSSLVANNNNKNSNNSMAGQQTNRNCAINSRPINHDRSPSAQASASQSRSSFRVGPANRQDENYASRFGGQQMAKLSGTPNSIAPERPIEQMMNFQQELKQAACDTVGSGQTNPSQIATRLNASRLEARKSLSQPVGSQLQLVQQHLQASSEPASDHQVNRPGQQQQQTSIKQQNVEPSCIQPSSGPATAAAAAAAVQTRLRKSSFQYVNTHEQKRRCSIGTGSGRCFLVGGTASQRKQSAVSYYVNPQQNNRFEVPQEPQAGSYCDRIGGGIGDAPSTGFQEGALNSSASWLDSTIVPQSSLRQQQQNVNRSSAVNQPYWQEPPTTNNSNNSSRRNLNAFSGQHATAFGVTLIPIPSDQFHLRRLSDQSNLVRRCSIIDDTIDGINMARNRSHSNIDSVSCANYFYQTPVLARRSPESYQQAQFDDTYSTTVDYRRPSQDAYIQQQYDPYSESYSVQTATGSSQQHQQPNSWLYQQQQQQVTTTNQLDDLSQQYQANNYHSSATNQRANNSESRRLSSIITPYAQKHRQSSEDMRSDSSSDIDDDIDDARTMQATMDFDDEQPNEYFAPPRALSNHLMDQPQPPVGGAQMAIPSVSVSEFSPGHRQYQAQQQQQSPLNDQFQQPYEQITTTPMQINTAIEQVIRQQQQQQQTRNNSNGSNELLTDCCLMPARRGSGARILPRIPGEQQQQSRSLLELPYSRDNAIRTDQPVSSTLDLPSATIRRASAPEGQNIKIVVDDIDGSGGFGMVAGTKANHHQHRNHNQRVVYGNVGQGELLERLVLYRDDSIDPATNMLRGFGLHVMGGKIDPGDNTLQACVSWVLANGPADKVGLKPNDKIVEWDGKCLVNMSYEQVADVIESSANIAELLVKPSGGVQGGGGQAATSCYMRSQRRLSQQTERDLKRTKQPIGVQFDGQPFPQNGIRRKYEIDAKTYMNMGSSANYQPAANSSDGQMRAGTGRKLPQIPVVNANGIDSAGSANNILGATSSFELQQQQQQQSLSTGELYTGGRGARQQYRMLPNSGGLLTRNFHSGELRSTVTTSNVNNQNMDRSSISQTGYTSLTQDNYYRSVSAQNEICGLIGLQISVDERVNQLEVSILSAINVDRDPRYDYYVRVKILPESNRFKPCTTQPSCDMNWKETFIFQNFPTQQVQRMALEIGIWVHDEACSRLSTKISQPICETLISIQSARERNTDFWPLMPPPSSAQARRKSLNDLIGTSSGGHDEKQYQQLSFNTPQQEVRRQSKQLPEADAGRLNAAQAYNLGGVRGNYAINRARSSSARNLPTDIVDVSQSRQPRRASDEVAGSSSHRLSTRISPATSRRSISVINVGPSCGDGQQHALLARPSSRLGSQSSILKQRRDSSKRHSGSAGTGSPNSGRYASPNGSVMRINDQIQQGISVTPTGRRSSLVGIQSMRGYRSQKNSHSGSTTDQDSPMRAGSTSQRAMSTTCTAAMQHVVNLNGTRDDVKQPQRESLTTSSHSSSPVPSANCSRRGSSERPNMQHLQRKDSFAMKTLRKLRRTISLNKNDQQQPSNEQSRRSSSSSHELSSEDVGLSRRLVSHIESVGKLKLSFVMTKGQLEVDVICAEGLKYEPESTLGIYVKMYIKGKGKSNKRKTRTVIANEAPVFKQILKYDGSFVDNNKALEVSVWHKQTGLRGKAPIGFTEIQLSELVLEQTPQISWYNLHPMDALCSSSIDE